jgi:glycosyltransferase involved in cell wall biosynthesis
VQENFTFLGHRDDIREIMAKSNIVLSLAKVPEAFGRTALEALSIGVPVVAYNHGGAAEVLSELFPEGKVSPHDINGVVSKVESFYTNTPRVKNINTFTLDKMLGKTLKVYTSLTGD